jgi:hypothetical protein
VQRTKQHDARDTEALHLRKGAGRGRARVSVARVWNNQAEDAAGQGDFGR